MQQQLFQAINESRGRQLTLNEIYNWFQVKVEKFALLENECHYLNSENKFQNYLLKQRNINMNLKKSQANFAFFRRNAATWKVRLCCFCLFIF